MSLPKKDKSITQRFGKFVQYYLGSFERLRCESIEDGELFAAIDNDEEYIHVQFKDLDSQEILDPPIVWRIKAWKSSYSKWQLDKERSARERKEWNLAVENTNRLIKAMCSSTGIEDAAIFRGIASKIARKKLDKGAEHFNIKLDKGE